MAAIGRRWRTWRRLVATLLGIYLLVISAMWFVPPPRIGLVAGRLQACPASPNCVCSFDEDAEHRTEPLNFTGDAAAAKQRLVAAVKSLPGSRIVADDGWYLHITCTSRFLRFVDDLECLIDSERQVIHVRSASRLGYSDLGVNRARIELLRRAWNAE